MVKFKLLQKLYIFFISLILIGCGSASRFSTRGFVEKIADTPEPEIFYNSYKNFKIIKSFDGFASFYAHKYHGRTTANGEIYNMYELTAAHPYFPFETILRIINLDNGKSVIVRINDRMPKHPERLIDLSLGTAKKLGMIKSGVIKVKLEILRWGKEEFINEN